MFKDRKDAGIKLAKALEKYKNRKDLLVLAIPRGGAEVGYETAKYLGADFSLIISRKLPYPDNPEAGFGAIAEDGSVFIFPYAESLLSPKTVKEIADAQKGEIRRRIEVLRDGKPLPEISGKTVILVDDGIAMGSTMRAAIMLCKHKNAQKIVVAAPVAGMDTKEALKELADEVLILETPLFFHAVAEAYDNWYDVPDSEVVQIVKKSRKFLENPL